MASAATGAAAGSRPAQPQPTMQATAAKATEPAAVPAPTAAGQHDVADAAMYKEMRTALCDFDSAGSPKDSPPRHRAFFTALRSVLGQVLEEKTDASRHVRLLAAHQWYVKHKPRPRPADMEMAAAMAASLSVQNPADVAATPASAAVGSRMASPAGGIIAGQKQQQQQQRHAFHVADAQQQLLGSYDAAGAEQQQSICTINTSRWREQQALRLHELEDEASIATALGSNRSGQPGAVHINSSGSGDTARPASCSVTAYLPEQPSLRAVPAIQAVSLTGSGAAAAGFSSGTAQGLGITPRGGSKPGAANTAHRCWNNSKLGAAAATAAALPPVDGLIPIGSLPSGKSFVSGSGSGSNANYGSCGYETGFAQWRAVADQQQEVQDSVAAHMHIYARHRARLEEEINRKQEMAMQLAATHNKLPDTGHGSTIASSATSGSSWLPGGRALLHCDSQHQPSQVATAYTGLGAGAGGVQRLAPVDKVKEVKQVLLQDSQRECAEVTMEIRKLGIAADADTVKRALLPLPDMPYMTCMAHLPRPGRYSSSTGGLTIKGKKKKRKLIKRNGSKAAANEKAK